MEKDKASVKVVSIISQYSMEKEFEITSTMSQIGIDSLKLIEVILDLESEFGVMIPDSCMTEEYFKSPQTIILLFDKLISSVEE